MSANEKSIPPTESILPAALAANLTYLDTVSQATPDELLYRQAAELLEAHGTTATIFDETTRRSQEARVTKYAHEVTSPDGRLTFFARIASFEDQSHPNTPARIIFGSSSDDKEILTSNANALLFSDSINGIKLISNKGTEPVFDNPEYLQLVQTIIESIESQGKRAQREMNAPLARRIADRCLRRLDATLKDDEPLTPPAKSQQHHHADQPEETRWHVVVDKTSSNITIVPEQKKPHRKTKIVAGVLSAAAATLCAVHVTMNSHETPEEIAKKYPEPINAALADYGTPVDFIPVINDYSNPDIPDAAETATSLIGPSAIPIWHIDEYDASEPGMRVSTFDFGDDWQAMHENLHASEMQMQDEYAINCDAATQNIPFPPPRCPLPPPRPFAPVPGSAFDIHGCYVIQGKFSEGKTRVFTKDPVTNQKITFEVTDPRQAKVCKKDPQETDFKGSIFLWQKPE